MTRTFSEKLADAFDSLVALLFVLFSAGLLIVCGIATAKMMVPSDEQMAFFSDSFALCFAGSLVPAVLLTAAMLLRRKPLSVRTHRAIRLGCLTLTGAFCVAFVLCAHAVPRVDQALCAEAAVHLMHGSATSFKTGQYVSNHPHQAGFVLYLFSVFSVFGENNTLAVQLLNCAALVGCAAALLRMMAIVDAAQGARTLLCLLFTLFLPLQLYVTFVYGTLPGLCLALWALTAGMDAVKHNRLAPALIAGLLMGLAVMVKNNYLVFAIGLGLYALAALMRRARRAGAAMLVGLALCTLLFAALPAKVIEHRTGQHIGDGIHPLSYVTMGLQEAPRGGPGWYNSYNLHTWQEAEMDRERQKDIALAGLKDRLSEFMQDKTYLLGFFYRKTVSQWAEPTFGSWVAQAESGPEVPDNWVNILVAQPFCERASGFLNVMMFSVFLYTLAQVLLTGGIGLPLCALVFVGGFVFHLFWEAKGQYTVVYFVLLFPMAAMGLHDAAHRLCRLCQKAAPDRHADRRAQVFAAVLLVMCVVCVPLAKLLSRYNERTEEYARVVSLSGNDCPESGLYELTSAQTGETLLALCNTSDVPDDEKLVFKLTDRGAFAQLSLPSGAWMLDGSDTPSLKAASGSAMQRWRLLRTDEEDGYALLTQLEYALTRTEDGSLRLSAYDGSESQIWRVQRLQ